MKTEDIENRIREKFHIVVDGAPPFVCDGIRKDLVFLFAELGYTKGAEIGVGSGINSLFLCQAIPGLKLICVDSWEPEYKRIRNMTAEYSYQKCVKRMKPYNAEIMRMTSQEASRLVSDGSLDFVYIDAMHDYDSVMSDITFWEPKVRVGGIISGHDYVNTRKAGVARAVDEYTHSHNISSYYTTIANSPIDKNASWFWVKNG